MFKRRLIFEFTSARTFPLLKSRDAVDGGGIRIEVPFGLVHTATNLALTQTAKGDAAEPAERRQTVRDDATRSSKGQLLWHAQIGGR